MKRTVWIFLALLLTGVCALYAQGIPNKAGLLVDTTRNAARKSEIAAVFNSQLSTFFVSSGRFTVIERDAIDYIREEHELSFSGAIEDNALAIEAGRLAEASYILFSTLESVTVTTNIYRTTEKKKNTNNTVTNEVYVEKRVYTVYAKANGSIYDIDAETTRYQASGSAMRFSTTTDRYLEISYDNNGKQISRKEPENRKIPTPPDVQKLIREATVESAQDIAMHLLRKIPLRGYIVDRQKKAVYVGLGSDKGLKNRVNLRINGENGKKAILQIDEVHDAYSVASIVRGDASLAARGAEFEMISPVFRADTMLWSMLVPGLGQTLHGFYFRGAGFFLLEAAGIAAATYLGWYMSDAVINNYPTLDSALWREGSGAGSQYDYVKRMRQISFGVTAGVAAVIYIWNVLDAGFLAETYNPFVKRNTMTFSYSADPLTMTHALAMNWRF